MNYRKEHVCPKCHKRMLTIEDNPLFHHGREGEYAVRCLACGWVDHLTFTELAHARLRLARM